jgi:hypothetical protein
MSATILVFILSFFLNGIKDESCRNALKDRISEIRTEKKVKASKFQYMKLKTTTIPFPKSNAEEKIDFSEIYQKGTEVYMKKKDSEYLVSGGKMYFVVHGIKRVIVKDFSASEGAHDKMNSNLLTLQKQLVDSALSVVCSSTKEEVSYEVKPKSKKTGETELSSILFAFSLKGKILSQRFIYKSGEFKEQKIEYLEISDRKVGSSLGLGSFIFDKKDTFRKDLKNYDVINSK